MSDFDPFSDPDLKFHSPYSGKETSALFIVGSIVVLLVIVGIILLVLFFTCNWPFGGSEKCVCKNSGGEWDSDANDKKGDCIKCPDSKEALDKKCVDKCTDGKIRNIKGVCEVQCPTGQIKNASGVCQVQCPAGQTKDASGVCQCQSGYAKDSMGICQLSCSTGTVLNGLKCVDDLSGNYLGYITSTNTPVSLYKWNIKHTKGGVDIYSGDVLKISTVFDGSTLKWGGVTGTWVPAEKRITWSNDSHWVRI